MLNLILEEEKDAEVLVEKNKKVFASNVALEKEESVCNQVVSVDIMHARLGHGSLSKMQHLSFYNCKHVNNFFCDTCSLAKHHRLPFNSSKSIAKSMFDLLHIDLWGPYKVPNITGDTYFLTILDDYYSRVTWTHLLSTKDQV